MQLAYLNFTAVVGLAAHEAARELGITPGGSTSGSSFGSSSNLSSSGASSSGASSSGAAADRAEYGTNASSPRLDDSIARAGGPADASWGNSRPSDTGLGQRVAHPPLVQRLAEEREQLTDVVEGRVDAVVLG